jgi:hypothetical protein
VKLSGGISSNRSHQRRAISTVPSVEPESTTTISTGTVWRRSASNVRSIASASFFARTTTLARGSFMV